MPPGSGQHSTSSPALRARPCKIYILSFSIGHNSSPKIHGNHGWFSYGLMLLALSSRFTLSTKDNASSCGNRHTFFRQIRIPSIAIPINQDTFLVETLKHYCCEVRPSRQYLSQKEIHASTSHRGENSSTHNRTGWLKTPEHLLITGQMDITLGVF